MWKTLYKVNMTQELKQYIAADGKMKTLLSGFLQKEKDKLVQLLVSTVDYEQSARFKGAIAEIDTILGKVM